jgi:hypothetical protein
LLQKTDGAYWLAVWDETQPHKVAVTFTQMASTLQVFDPLAGVAPIQTDKSTRQVSVSLRGHPVLVRFVPSAEPLTAKAGVARPTP